MISGGDPRMCDSNTDCKEDWDQKHCLTEDFQGTETLVVSGGESRTRGVYQLERRNGTGVPLFYSRVDGWGFIRWWRGSGGEGEWLIGGEEAGVVTVVYTAQGSQRSVPSTDWTDNLGNGAFDILVRSTDASVATLLERETLEEDEDVITCKDKDGRLLKLSKEDERVCDGVTWDCQQGRDERCPFRSTLMNTSFLIVSGTDSRDGVYEIQNDTSGKASHYKQVDGKGLIVPFKDQWKLGSGRSHKNFKLLFQSAKNNRTIPETGWMDAAGEPVNVRVSKVPKSVNRLMLVESEDEYEVPEGLLCVANRNGQRTEPRRLFIYNEEKKKCDATWHCDNGRKIR